MPHPDSWYVIVNPVSGRWKGKKKWPFIKSLLEKNDIPFHFDFSEWSGHEALLAKDAIRTGYNRIAVLGGDGTIHHTVNGIMSQTEKPASHITLGVIPVGTGNDWVRSHGFPKRPEESVTLMKNFSTTCCDVGKLSMEQDGNPVYFINLAGTGFDAYVVRKVDRFKRFGAVAYLLGALIGLFKFRNHELQLSLETKLKSQRFLMVIIGLGKYSGGGMRLTEDPDPADGLFDISLAGDMSRTDIIKALPMLFNGRIRSVPKVETFKAGNILVTAAESEKSFIEADGEIVGSGSFKAEIVLNAIQIVQQKKPE